MEDQVNEQLSTSVGSTTNAGADPETLDATQNLIVRLSQQLEDLEKQQKDVKDMLKSVFENDEVLAKAQVEAEEQLKTAKSRKTEIAKSQQAVDLKIKLADLSEDMKLIVESLNTHLLNYYQLTGSQTVDFPGGEEREINIRAKLRKGAPKQEA